MNKVALVECLAAWTGMGKEAVDGVFEEIGEAMANGEGAQIIDFGTFGTRNRPPAPGVIRGWARACRWRLRPCPPESEWS